MSKESVQTQKVKHRDDYGAKLGMWIFLFTEIFFFGGLFLVYAVYKFMYSAEFHAASLHLDAVIGAVNSMILLTSSMTISIALTSAQKGNNILSYRMIGLTFLLAVIFLINKYFEWDHKIMLDLYPGSGFMLGLKHGYILFFGLYFFMTGLHALHIIIGLVLLSICFIKVKSGKISAEDNILLVNSTLYWHLVDLIWIFLFPLLYLIT
jgi:cytochrome c oxidase subunit III